MNLKIQFIIDEIQKAPELFEQIKIMCDESEERGSGGIVCMCEEVIPIDDMNYFIPCNLI